MKIERIATQYETRYMAKDGTQWEAEWLCRQYEELLENPSPLKDLKFFNDKGDPIDVFALGQIPCFCYLVLTQRIEHYSWSVVKSIIGNKENDEASYHLPTSEGVWYNDWSNAYNGRYGSNGWVQVDSVEYLESKIKSCQNKIKLIEKMLKNP